MKFIELVNKRQSDRKYLNKNVEKEKIERCLEAAILAPSASNSQPWSFIVITDTVLKNKVAGKTFGPAKLFNKFVPQAPVIIVIVMEKPKIIRKHFEYLLNKLFPLTLKFFILWCLIQMTYENNPTVCNPASLAFRVDNQGIEIEFADFRMIRDQLGQT